MLARARRESTEMSLQMTLEPKPTISAVQERRADRDRELVEALRLHEPTAAERLVATYGDRAYRLATGITGNAQDAEEVVQDVFWTAMLLRDVEGLSHLQIAEVLSLSVPTVKSRVHRARLFLRKQLGDTMTTLGAPIATEGGS